MGRYPTVPCRAIGMALAKGPGITARRLHNTIPPPHTYTHTHTHTHTGTDAHTHTYTHTHAHAHTHTHHTHTHTHTHTHITCTHRHAHTHTHTHTHVHTAFSPHYRHALWNMCRRLLLVHGPSVLPKTRLPVAWWHHLLWSL